MRDSIKFATYLLCVVLLGSLLAPPLFWAGRALMEQGLLTSLHRFGFEKYLNRAVMVVAVALLVPFLRWVRVSRLSDMGLRGNPKAMLHLMGGFAIGAGGLACLVLALVRTGFLRWQGLPDALSCGLWLISAMVVACIEESFFRGALLGVLRRNLPRRVAAALLACFFAALHCIRSDPGLARVGEASWLTGFALVPHLFWQFSHPGTIATFFAMLVVLGLVLSEAVEATRSLWLSVGLHAGWVFAWLCAHGATAIERPNLWVADDLRSGLAPLLLMLVTGAGLWVWRTPFGGSRRRRAAPNCAASL